MKNAVYEIRFALAGWFTAFVFSILLSKSLTWQFWAGEACIPAALVLFSYIVLTIRDKYNG